MQEITKKLEQLLDQITVAMNKLEIATDQAKVRELEDQSKAPTFWRDSDQAAKVSQQLAALKSHVEGWNQLKRWTAEALELAKLGDPGMTAEISQSYQKLHDEYGRREFELKLSGQYDKNSAVVSIYAGTGGTDAQDWAEMLLRMYLRYCEKAGYHTQVLDQSPGEEAGLKSVTFEVDGQFAYGRLKAEKGVHRLVRLSPFNADHLRQTSFALVEVMPQLEVAELAIDSKDLRIDVFRAGGHGGQSVNTTDSAVRVTHLPTGITVAIQNERSQLQNKAKALTILKSRLKTLMEEQHQSKLSEVKGQTTSANWGNQIRSYVLHPYTKVKDHRTGYETAQAKDVLDGTLEAFIEAYLDQRVGSKV